jgi:outer membrane protein assembly factor BamB
MKVAVVSGQYFEIDQTNENNRAAGVQTLYGAILDRGRRIVLLNVGNWKEVWEGTPSGDTISGTVTAGSTNFTFTISAGGHGHHASTTPFFPGKILRWKTNAAGGQNGNFRVTGTNGATFTLEQKNDKNVAAGIVRMDGEVKDGKIYIYNRQWNETWIGTLADGVVSGKINDRHTFQIAE